MRQGKALVINPLTVEASLIRKWLAEAGYEAEIVSGESELKERIAYIRPDVILIAEAGLSATETVTLRRILREQPEMAGVPVVLITSRLEEELGEEIAAENVAVLHRPFGAKEITHILARL